MTSQKMQIEPGAQVEASDAPLGTVSEVVVRPETGELAYLLVRRAFIEEPLVVPADLIASVPHPREVRVRVTRDEAIDQGANVPREAFLAKAVGNTLRIPLVEERLVASTKPVDLGEVRIHTHVDYHDEVVRQLVTRDDLVIEHVPVNQVVERPLGPRHEGEWLVIPIVKEVLVVQKQLVLQEEVRIRKRQVTEEQEVHEQVRHTRVEIEDATVHGISMPHTVSDAERDDTPPKPVLPSPQDRPSSAV